MGHAPENTIASFQKAIALGCDEVELDVWLDADERFVVSHDRPRPGAVTLDEVLDFCRGRVVVNVELKCETGGVPARAAGALVARHLALRGDPGVYLSSVWPSALEGARDAAADVRLAYVFALPVARGSLLETARDLRLAQLHPERRIVRQDFVRVAHDAGLAVHAWTVNDPDEIARFAVWGVDGIISDYPERVPHQTVRTSYAARR